MIDYEEQFEQNGYFVIEYALDQEQCSELFQLITEAYGDRERSYVHEPVSRIHAPLPMATSAFAAIRKVLHPAYRTVDCFLRGSKRLVELSSITVFPGAKAQPLHTDEYQDGKYIVSIFVNLFPSAEGVGALEVVPASHRHPTIGNDSLQTLTLPAGSAMFMNGKLRHRGSENRSLDRIRPVFYFSFGDPDIVGPVYSLREGVRFELADFASKPAHAQCTPTLTLDHQPFRGLAEARQSLCLLRPTGAPVFVDLDENDDWIIDLLGIQDFGRKSAERLATELGKDLHDVLSALESLEAAGIVSWQ